VLEEGILVDQEDFEMRPLTAGLGFHKRPVSLKEHIVRSNAVSDIVANQRPALPPDEMLDQPKARTHSEMLNEIKSALEPLKDRPKSNINITRPLPRNREDIRATAQIEPEIRERQPRIDPIQDIDFQIPHKEIRESKINIGTRRDGHDGLTQELSLVSFSPAAAILDGVIVLAISLLFLVSLVSVTGIDFAAVLLNASTDYVAQFSLVLMYFSLAQVYLIASRSLAGCSLGEWTFDLQVGEEQQMNSAGYPLRIFARSLFMVATGLFLLPLLSLIIRKDLAGILSGTRLYRKNI
jgi:hypothetical protein